MIGSVKKMKLFKNLEFGWKSYAKPTPLKVKIFFHCISIACVSAATILYTLLQACSACCIAMGVLGFIAAFIQEYISETNKDDRKP